MKRLIVLTPSKGQVCIEQRDMLMKLAVRMSKAGHRLITCDDCTAGFLHHSRNLLLAALAARSNILDWALWLDSDTYFDPDAVLAMLDRPEEMIIWNYPKRIAVDIFNPPESQAAWVKTVRDKGGMEWTSSPLMTNDGKMIWSEDKKLVRMQQCAFGAVMMKPSVALKMRKACPQSKPDWAGRVLIPAFNLLDNAVGEDYSFTRRWNEIGGEMWCEPGTFVNNGQSGGRFSLEIKKADDLTQIVAPMFAVCA